MKKLYWLIRRECWENKLILVWINLIVATLVVLFFAVRSGHGNFQFKGEVVAPSQMDVVQVEFALSSVVESFFIPCTFFGMLLPILIAAYCHSSLFNERQDRSILFWLSMPVSSVNTVASKFIFAAIVLPAATFAFAVLAYIPIVITTAVRLQMDGLPANVYAAVVSNPRLYLLPLKTIAVLPVYILWALPTIGWFMLVSAWARSKPALWAIGLPMVSMGLINILNHNLSSNLNMRWLEFNLVGRSLLSVIPASWFAYEKMPMPEINYLKVFAGWPGDMYSHSWEMLGKSELWCGVVLGVAMLALATYLREKRAAN